MKPMPVRDGLTARLNDVAANSAAYRGYRDVPIPHVLDGAVDAVVDAYAAATQPERRRATATMTAIMRSILRAYAERAAMGAVRHDDVAWLRRGCLALLATVERASWSARH